MPSRLKSAKTLRRSGFRSTHLPTDVALGVIDGLDTTLWCYIYASIIFAGVFAAFLPLGIAMLLIGWAGVSVFIALTSNEPLHVANPDEQSVVVMGAIASMLALQLGDAAASPTGLNTLLAVIALTSLLFAVSCYMVGRFGLSRLLEHLPFPVVCGFMAGIGWLLFRAGIEVAGDAALRPGWFSSIWETHGGPRLLLAMLCGAAMFAITVKVTRFWTLPVALLAILIAYYAAVLVTGISYEAQLANGWLFAVPGTDGGIRALVAQIDPRLIDWRFVLASLPPILAVVFLALLDTSLTLVTLKASSPSRLEVSEEFERVGQGNLVCALVCSPPTYTDVVATSLYREFGASSRWLPLSSSAVGLLVAVFGGAIIGYMPKLVVCAGIFLFAFHIFYEWLFKSTRGFSLADHAIVWVILATVAIQGFIEGIAFGVALTAIVFIVRYAMISAIGSRGTLTTQRSSVERRIGDNVVLNRNGERVVIYRLRGFLFFGSANAVVERITRDDLEAQPAPMAVLIDMRNVTGVDASALNAFSQMKASCSRHGVVLAFSAPAPDVARNMSMLDLASTGADGPLVFDDADFALEYLEDAVLAGSGVPREYEAVPDMIARIITDVPRREALLAALQRRRCAQQEVLFVEGEPNEGLFIVEQGMLSAFVNVGGNARHRVKKFTPGSLIGELSAYLQDSSRTATVVADTDAVLYHLNIGEVAQRPLESAAIHELVATTLAARVSYMNARLLVEKAQGS